MSQTALPVSSWNLLSSPGSVGIAVVHCHGWFLYSSRSLNLVPMFSRKALYPLISSLGVFTTQGRFGLITMEYLPMITFQDSKIIWTKSKVVFNYIHAKSSRGPVSSVPYIANPYQLLFSQGHFCWREGQKMPQITNISCLVSHGRVFPKTFGPAGNTFEDALRI